jgi:hypothetical protein
VAENPPTRGSQVIEPLADRGARVSLPPLRRIERTADVLELAKNLGNVRPSSLVETAECGVSCAWPATRPGAGYPELGIEAESTFTAGLSSLSITPGVPEELVEEGGFGRPFAEIGALRPSVKSFIQLAFLIRVLECLVVELPDRTQKLLGDKGRMVFSHRRSIKIGETVYA